MDLDADRVLQQLLDLIDEHGWAVRQVGSDPSTGEPGFSYTVGLTAMQHPEVVVTGMPDEPALAFLNLVGDDVRDGKRYCAGHVTDELTTPGAPVVFIQAEEVSGLTAVEQVYGHVEALQLVWPDSTGTLPWQPGYRNAPGVQPLLGSLPHPQ